MKTITKFLFLAFWLFTSCSQHDDLETNSAEKKSEAKSRLQVGENVKLLRVTNTKERSCGRLFCSFTYTRVFEVEVANLAFAKVVQVRQQLGNGQWEDINLAYSYTTAAGTEVWKGVDSKNYSTSSDIVVYGNKIAVKYTVNNNVYWDNNNSNDYYVTSASEGTTTFLLGNNINILNSSYGFYDQSNPRIRFNVSADLRNIAFAKEVKITYTTNNWASSTTASLQYNSSYSNSEYEKWSWFTNFSSRIPVKFFLSYKVNGITYYDNNYGSNYSAN